MGRKLRFLCESLVASWEIAVVSFRRGSACTPLANRLRGWRGRPRLWLILYDALAAYRQTIKLVGDRLDSGLGLNDPQDIVHRVILRCVTGGSWRVLSSLGNCDRRCRLMGIRLDGHERALDLVHRGLPSALGIGGHLAHDMWVC
jgi:hypothetical protein